MFSFVRINSFPYCFKRACVHMIGVTRTMGVLTHARATCTSMCHHSARTLICDGPVVLSTR